MTEPEIQAAQKSYKDVVAWSGFTEAQVDRMVNNMDDILPVTGGNASLLDIKRSPIHGVGVFTGNDVPEGVLACVVRIGERRTWSGRFINHSHEPNVRYEWCGSDIHARTLRPIAAGEELLVDYKQSIELVRSKCPKP